MATKSSALNDAFECVSIDPKEGVCGVSGCKNKATVRGCCPMHYRRISTSLGKLSIEEISAPKRANVPCSVEGCTGQYVVHGFCNKHRIRIRRHGNVNGRVKRGRVGGHPLYSMWRRMEKNGAFSEEFLKFWDFVDCVGERPSRHHVLCSILSEGKIGPQNYEWKLPIKLAFDASDPEAKKEYNRLMRKLNPEYEIRAFLKRYKFKSIEEYQNMVIAHNNLCGSCGDPETVMRGTPPKIQRLSVDHDHKTGKIRGLLCVNCNKIIGHAHDDVEKLKKAILYLERTNGKE